jgi:acid phosphatase type 7
MALSTFVRRVAHDAARLLLAVLAATSIASAQQPRTAADSVPAAVFVTWDGDPTTTVSVDWHLTANTDIPAIEVRGPGLSRWRRHEGRAIAFPFSTRTVRRARIDGLRPGSVYELRLGGSRSYRYRTMPARLSRPVRFASGGDTQAGETTFGVMNRIVASRDVDFVLLGGDLAYSNGDPRLVAREEAWYETVTRTLVTRDGRLIPVIAAIGNHEVFSTRDTSEATARMMRETGVKRGDSPYYSALHAHARDRQYSVIDVGDYLSLVLLNTGHTAPVQGAQTAWLQDALRQRTSVPYVFPTYHVPGYPSVRAFEGSTSMLVREHWAPLFERYDVRVAFENHDHAYKRTVPIKGGRRDSTGVVYIGDGAWGAVPRRIGLEHTEPAWYLETAKSVNHAIFVTLDRRAARFEMVDTAGVRFDTHRARARCLEPVACR